MVYEKAVLSITNLQIAYEDNQVISDLSFSVEKRDVLIILGPNNAGKTTLLRIYCPIVAPSHGMLKKNQ